VQLTILRGKNSCEPVDTDVGLKKPEMVSDIHEFSIPEVRLFFRFCEHSDSDVLPIGTQLTSALLFTLVHSV